MQLGRRTIALLSVATLRAHAFVALPVGLSAIEGIPRGILSGIEGRHDPVSRSSIKPPPWARAMASGAGDGEVLGVAMAGPSRVNRS